MVGIGGDKSLADRLFFVFDAQGAGELDLKEMIITVEMFRESSFEQKLKIFFKLCDVSQAGNLSEEDVYNVMKYNLSTSEEKRKMKDIIKAIFIEADLDGDGHLNKEEIEIACKNQSALKVMIQHSIAKMKDVDKIVTDDLEE